MTEQEWLESTDPTPMLEYVSHRGNASVAVHKRKLRQFAVACCRGIWKLLPDKRSRSGIETAERKADGWVNERELQSARDETLKANELFIGKSTHLAEAARAAWSALHDREFMWVPDVVRSAVRFSISDAVDGYHFSIDADAEGVRGATLEE